MIELGRKENYIFIELNNSLCLISSSYLYFYIDIDIDLYSFLAFKAINKNSME